MIRRLIFGICLLAGIVSCKKDILVSMEFPISNHQWLTGDRKAMEFDVTDTSQIYTLEIDVSHADDYAFQNLYVRMHTTFPSGKEESSVTSLELANKDGSWSGDCTGDLCSVSLSLQSRFRFPERGTYKWGIEPYMRIDTVKGIKSLHVICRKAEG